MPVLVLPLIVVVRIFLRISVFDGSLGVVGRFEFVVGVLIAVLFVHVFVVVVRRFVIGSGLVSRFLGVAELVFRAGILVAVLVVVFLGVVGLAGRLSIVAVFLLRILEAIPVVVVVPRVCHIRVLGGRRVLREIVTGWSVLHRDAFFVPHRARVEMIRLLRWLCARHAGHAPLACHSAAAVGNAQRDCHGA